MLKLEAVSHRRGLGEHSFTLEVPCLSVEKGEIIALTGVSGSGKSTLLEIVGLILKPHAMSRFTIGHHDVSAYWANGAKNQLSRLRSQQLGFVLQTGGLLPYLTVIENITLSRSILGLDKVNDFVLEICALLAIDHLFARKPDQLSIGERQRTAIARALAHQPKLLLADEPTAALDPFHADQVMSLLVKLTRELSLTSIIVTHDWGRIQEMGVREIKTTCKNRNHAGTISVLTG